MRKAVSLLGAMAVALGLMVPAGAGVKAPVPSNAPEGWGSMVGPVKGRSDEPPPAAGMVVNRAKAWTPKAPGTRETIVLQYGPYVVHPGADLPRADAEAIVGADGFVIAAEPVVRYADGSVPSLLKTHIHHAHWVWPDAENSNGYRWFFGTGEEQTQGSIDLRAQSDARYVTDKLRYGIRMQKGEQLAFLSMLHNKSTETQVVWLEARLEFVYGTAAEIKAATGEDFHHIVPTLHGSTFNVPRTGGMFAWPRDATPEMLAGFGSSMKAGIGHTWTSPFDGTIIVGAGHMHPGGDNVVVSNLGSESSPCGATWLSDPDSDGFPGVALANSRHITRDNIRPSEDFQMGITQPGFRARIRKGDVIAINGVYDATFNAYPDAMSFFGFYTDTTEKIGAACSATVITSGSVAVGPGPHGNPDPSNHTVTDINRDWATREHLPVCAAGSCDRNLPAPAYGPNVTIINIAGFAYVPGNQGLDAASGAPTVIKGQPVTFVNLDMAAGIRHTVTTCVAPCDGPYVANYPFPDGHIESGVMGTDYQYLETYVTATGRPDWTLDTSTLDSGRYTFFCRLHPSMRGSFYVTEG